MTNSGNIRTLLITYITPEAFKNDFPDSLAEGGIFLPGHFGAKDSETVFLDFRTPTGLCLGELPARVKEVYENGNFPGASFIYMLSRDEKKAAWGNFGGNKTEAENIGFAVVPHFKYRTKEEFNATIIEKVSTPDSDPNNAEKPSKKVKTGWDGLVDGVETISDPSAEKLAPSSFDSELFEQELGDGGADSGILEEEKLEKQKTQNAFKSEREIGGINFTAPKKEPESEGIPFNPGSPTADAAVAAKKADDLIIKGNAYTDEKDPFKLQDGGVHPIVPAAPKVKYPYQMNQGAQNFDVEKIIQPFEIDETEQGKKQKPFDPRKAMKRKLAIVYFVFAGLILLGTIYIVMTMLEAEEERTPQIQLPGTMNPQTQQNAGKGDKAAAKQKKQSKPKVTKNKPRKGVKRPEVEKANQQVDNKALAKKYDEKGEEFYVKGNKVMAESFFEKALKLDSQSQNARKRIPPWKIDEILGKPPAPK